MGLKYGSATKFIIFLATVFSLSTNEAKADNSSKKTLCSVTINSDNEISLFKKSFSPDLWDFVELTDFAKPNDKAWFEKACMQKVQCDILLVSGHFGGTFFGSSDYTLSIENLESYSCRQDCQGILGKPKEIFLFGCNTLEGVRKDTRTRQQYYDALIEDGFSIAQAQQVVAYRYSAYGNTFSTRMSQVFEYTPRIYGFNNIAPSGKTVYKPRYTYSAC